MLKDFDCVKESHICLCKIMFYCIFPVLFWGGRGNEKTGSLRNKKSGE